MAAQQPLTPRFIINMLSEHEPWTLPVTIEEPFNCDLQGEWLAAGEVYTFIPGPAPVGISGLPSLTPTRIGIDWAFPAQQEEDEGDRIMRITREIAGGGP
jgi:hypothetical protein